MNVNTLFKHWHLNTFHYLFNSWWYEGHVYEYGTESVHTRSQAEECEQNNFLHINSSLMSGMGRHNQATEQYSRVNISPSAQH